MSSRLRILVLGLLALVLIAPIAAASPQDVIDDFREPKQTLDRKYSWSDLRAAVTLIRTQRTEDPSFQEQFAEEVQRVIARDYLGLARPGPTTMDAANLPSWVIAIATASFILVVTGIAAAVWRRVRPLR